MDRKNEREKVQKLQVGVLRACSFISGTYRCASNFQILLLINGGKERRQKRVIIDGMLSDPKTPLFRSKRIVIIALHQNEL